MSFSVASYPLLLEYNQSIVYTFAQGFLTDVDDDWVFRKPFANASANASSLGNYMALLTALVNNSQPMQLDSVSLVSPDLTPSDEALDDANGDGAGTNEEATKEGMSRPIASIVAITVVLMLLCVFLLTCQCE